MDDEIDTVPPKGSKILVPGSAPGLPHHGQPGCGVGLARKTREISLEPARLIKEMVPDWPGGSRSADGDPIGSMEPRTVASVLSEIADIASETLELHDVLDRVANSVRRLIPFNYMTVVSIVDGERVVLHASTSPQHDPGKKCLEIPLTAWSPRWRPQAVPYSKIEDARAELDPTFPMDAQVLNAGLGSGIWEPFRKGSSFVGGVWLWAQATHAFDDEHQKVLRPIAALLGSAVEHWRIWDAERRRQDRLDRVETLLGTLAESLDVREVFQRISAELQTILPHDLMNLTELDVRARTIQITASAGDVPVRTDVFPLTEQEVEESVDFEIIQDILRDLPSDTERRRLIRSSGLRSWLHVPVLLSGEVKGSLSILHREPSRYDRDDAEVARRVADRIALTLSHHRLAEEARIAREARERAERLEATVETLARELESRGRTRIVGVSSSWKETLGAVGLVAATETTVLLTGESGTGKEVISSLIHQGSPRAGKPLVAINCAALPEQLLESELFGHEKGAFTGAIATKIGRIEQAAGGTLFLDEIAEMSPMVQAKFLRVLEEREFQRLGGTRTLKADVRVIAATNRDLAAAIARQQFREDLFYRLNVFQIHIAPLRERPEDILPLAEAFLAGLGEKMGRPAAGISRDTREWLREHPWPGNVRELRNAIERAILLCDGGLITKEHLPTPVARPASSLSSGLKGSLDPSAPLPASGVDLEAVEKDLVAKALGQTKGNKSQAARLLKLTRAQFYSRLEKYGLAKPRAGQPSPGA
jgi:transcriptional regulator with GAF, ATPase, and Fis domain